MVKIRKIVTSVSLSPNILDYLESKLNKSEYVELLIYDDMKKNEAPDAHLYTAKDVLDIREIRAFNQELHRSISTIRKNGEFSYTCLKCPLNKFVVEDYDRIQTHFREQHYKSASVER